MLLDRKFEPGREDILYHYCSASSFEAIVRTGSIRFSDINMMNDAQEMRWGYKVFEDAATELLTSKIPDELAGLDKNFIDEIDKMLSPMALYAQPFVSCFSKEPDQLSQWRAYADDGFGFALGFSASALQSLPITLMEVAYDTRKQIVEMKRAIAAIYLEYKDSPTGFDERSRESCTLLGAYFAALKNPSFHEEREVRAVHLVNVRVEKHSTRFDVSGFSQGQPKPEIRFRVSDHSIVGFLDLPISVALNPILRVVLGPKSPNAPGNPLMMMSHYGHRDVTIERSKCPYR